MLRSVSIDTSIVGQHNEYETSDGIRYNTFQYDSTEELPEGNYYIFSSYSNNKVLTLRSDGDNYVAALQLFTGEGDQLWRVYKNGEYYHIQNIKYQKDIILFDSSDSLAYLNDPSLSADSQNVTITPLGNGYYTISPYNTTSVQASYNPTYDAVYSLTSSGQHTQRWKFVVAS